MPPAFRSIIQLEISKIINLQKLRPPKDAVEWNLIIRAYLTGDKPLAVTDTLVITSAESTPDITTTLTVNLEFSTWSDLDSIVYYPLVINYYEIEFIRDKKKPVPDEKTELLGQTLFDLMPFVLGSTEVTETLMVFPPLRRDATDNQSLGTAVSPEEVTVNVIARTENPLLPEEYSNCFNILEFFLEGCYAMPSTWMNNNNNSSYTMTASIPTSGTHQRLLTVTIKLLQEIADTCMVKWPTQNLFVSDYVHMGAPAPRVQSAVVSPVKKSPYLPFNTLFRCILPSDAEECFKTKVMGTKTWSLEVFSVSYPEKHTGAKPKKAADNITSAPEEPVISKHGVAYIDLEPLLHPGICTVSGSFPIRPFTLAEFSEKTNTKSAAYELYPGTVTAAVVDSEKKAVISTGKKILDHHSTLTFRKSMAPSATPSQDTMPLGSPRLQDDADPYNTCSSFVTLKISLQKPLVPRRTSTVSLATLSEHLLSLSSQPGSSTPNDNGLAATRALHHAVRNLRGFLISLYKTKPSDDWTSFYQTALQSAETSEEILKLQQNLYHHILCLVRDRFYRGKPFSDRSEYKEFVRTVYVNLIREVNSALQGDCSQSDTKGLPTEEEKKFQKIFDLRVHSLQHELDGNFDSAEQCLVLRTKDVRIQSKVWQELGMFQLRFGKLDDAVLSFLNELRSDSLNVDLLVLLGYTFFELGKQNWAQTIFESVVTLCPASPAAWTVLGLFYEHLSHDSLGAYTFIKEQAYYRAHAALGVPEEVLRKDRESLEKQQKTLGCEIIHFPTGESAVLECQCLLKKLLHPRIPLPACHESSSYRTPTEGNLFPPVMTLNTYQQYMKTIITADTVEFSQNIFWYSMPYLSSAGLLRFLTKSVTKLAGVCPIYETVFWTSSVRCLLAHRKYDNVQTILYETSQRGEQSASYYANCGHLNYVQGKPVEAAQTYEEAVKRKRSLQNWEVFPVYYRLGTLCERMENHQAAKEFFHAAAKIHGTCRTWTGCGIASYKLGDIINAEYALRQALALDPTNSVAHNYFAKICKTSKGEVK